MDVLTCHLCTTKYDLEDKEPIVLACCGDTMCRQCFLAMVSPQDNTFTCPLCTQTTVFEKTHNILVNKQLRALLEKRDQELQDAIRVHCSLHQRDKVEYFCGSCQSLACMRCVVEVHGDHLELC